LKRFTVKKHSIKIVEENFSNNRKKSDF